MATSKLQTIVLFTGRRLMGNAHEQARNNQQNRTVRASENLIAWGVTLTGLVSPQDIVCSPGSNKRLNKHFVNKDMSKYNPQFSSILPPLSKSEYESLKNSIRLNGIQVPILIDEFDNVIDGWHRLQIADELELDDIPITTKSGLSTLQKIQLAISLNKDRRQMSSSQLATLAVEAEALLAEEAKERQEIGNNQFGVKEKIPEASKGQARDQAAELFGTNGRYVQDAKKLKNNAPELFEQVKSGTISLPEAKNKYVHFSSEKSEWDTPSHIIEKLLLFWGTIDLDPCSNDSDSPNVPAKKHYTEKDNGLILPWSGNVYMNPPYGNEISHWVNKLASEYEAGNINEGIALTPSRTDTKWFKMLRKYPRCFIVGRLQFSGYDNNAPFPSMITYLGKRLDDFYELFSDLGDIYILWGKK